MGVAIEMPAAVAALWIEVGDELCERAVVQVLAIPCEDGAGLQPAGILLAEAIHRFPPEAATAAMNRRPRSSMETCSTLMWRLKNNGFSSVVSRYPVSLLPGNRTQASVRPIVEFRFALRADFFALRGPLSIIARRYSRIPTIFVDSTATHWSRTDTRTNQSPKPCSGASHNCLLLGIQVVVSVPCQTSYATARDWNIRTLPCLCTMCQGDSVR
jgi:hypothetical protein